MSPRILYLDTGRAILMSLGVILHSALIFSDTSGWLIQSQQTTPLATFIAAAIHQFRMPAFFVIAGYFAAMSLNKYSIRQFFVIRLRRILIPLLTIAMSLNPLQYYLLCQHQGISPNWSEYLHQGTWIQHLWFLVNLLIYFAIAGVGWGLFQRVIECFKNINQRTLLYLTLFVMPFWHLAVLSLNKLGINIYSSWFGINVYSILDYWGYFFAGLWIFKAFNSNSVLINIPVIISFAVTSVLLWLSVILQDNPALVAQTFAVYSKILATWLIIALLFNLFALMSQVRTKLWYWTADAAYTIYLTHHIIVVVLGLVAIKLDWSFARAFPSICILTLAFTITFHHVCVRRFQWCSLLINGHKSSNRS